MQEYREPFIEPEVEKRSRLLSNWRSCLLLAVMLVGVMATPLAIFLRWNAERRAAIVEKPIDSGKFINRIAYIALDGQLATISPDGNDDRRLTDHHRIYRFPAWSPDGSRLAVTSEDGLHVFPDDANVVESNEYQTLFANGEDPPFYLYWSPNGSQVSFLTGHPTGLALYIVDATEGSEEEAKLVATGQPFYWDWLPGSDRILIHTGLSGPDARLAIIKPETTETAGNIAEPGLFQAPGVSASGRYQAFAALNNDLSEIVITNNEGERVFTSPHFGRSALLWSPKEELLAYISPRFEASAAFGPLRLANPENGDTWPLTFEPVLAFFWSPDGTEIAYLTLPGLDDGSTQAQNGAVKKALYAKPARQRDFELAVWVVDIETGFQRRLITFVPSRTFINEFLPFFDQYALSHQLWSPGSDALVLPVVANGVSRITVVSVPSGESVPIATGEIGFWSLQ